MDDRSDYEALTKRGRLVVTLQTWDHLAAHVITTQYKEKEPQQQQQPQPPGGMFARKRYQMMCQLVSYPTTQQFDQPIEKKEGDVGEDEAVESEEDLNMTWD